MDISIGSPKNFEDIWAPPLRRLTTRNMPLSHKCYHSKFGHSTSNGWCITTEILQKSLILHVPPFMVTQGRWNRHGSISYLWLPI